jgi:Cu2+-exporting ATPase
VVSVVNAFRASGHVYFDSATMFVFFLTLGRFLERRARRQALTRFDALAEMLPPCALRRRGDRLERVGTVEIEPGDVLVVEPGAIVPADGSLLSERASIDESLLSGEAMPRSRGRGEPVIGGTLNVGRNPIEIGASTRSCAGYLDRVRGLLDRAIADRPRFVRLADRYARWFVAAVLSVTAATGLAWWLTVPARAFDVVLSMLVVTCPCALSLATPTALAVALSGLARHGVLLTSARVLERLSAVRCWLFDKTGTLTSGDIVLTGAETVADLDEEQCMAIAAALEAGVDHPIAAAFDGRAAGSRAQDVEYVAGAGVSGVVDGKRYRLGSPGYALDAERAPLSGEIWLAGDDRVLCRFGLSDRLRPTAGAAVAALAGAGHQVALVSGDCAAAVSKTARDLGIADFFFEQKPEDKLALIRQRQQQGFAVAAVGDGINDAPFLAGADVSVAMMEGSRLAQASASIVFTGEDLTTLAKLPEWARRTRRVIAQNLAWAVAYNAVALPAAAAGWVSPWMAALGMSLSSVVVVTNALRLRGQLARGERAGARAPRLMQPLQRPSP